MNSLRLRQLTGILEKLEVQPKNASSCALCCYSLFTENLDIDWKYKKLRECQASCERANALDFSQDCANATASVDLPILRLNETNTTEPDEYEPEDEISVNGCELGMDFGLIGATRWEDVWYVCNAETGEVDAFDKQDFSNETVIPASECSSCCVDAVDYHGNYSDAFNYHSCQVNSIFTSPARTHPKSKI